MSAKMPGTRGGCWRNRDDPHTLGCRERQLRDTPVVGGARLSLVVVARNVEYSTAPRNSRPFRAPGEGGRHVWRGVAACPALLTRRSPRTKPADLVAWLSGNGGRPAEIDDRKRAQQPDRSTCGLSKRKGH